MKFLPKSQQRILEFLLGQPQGATLDEIAAHLAISKTAAKAQVIKLENLGAVGYEDSRGGVGRPRRRYLLSPDGHEEFPRQYSWFSDLLLDLLAENMGAPRVAQLMTKLAAKVAGSMASRFEAARASGQLLAEVTAALNELGYRVFLRKRDQRKGAVLEATNCVYHAVAKKHPELCQFDIQFIEKTTGMSVELESCIAKGGPVCRFCLRK